MRVFGIDCNKSSCFRPQRSELSSCFFDMIWVTVSCGNKSEGGFRKPILESTRQVEEKHWKHSPAGKSTHVKREKDDIILTHNTEGQTKHRQLKPSWKSFFLVLKGWSSLRLRRTRLKSRFNILSDLDLKWLYKGPPRTLFHPKMSSSQISTKPK